MLAAVEDSAPRIHGYSISVGCTFRRNVERQRAGAQRRDYRLEFQGHHANQACYKSGIMCPQYHGILVLHKSLNC